MAGTGNPSAVLPAVRSEAVLRRKGASGRWRWSQGHEAAALGMGVLLVWQCACWLMPPRHRHLFPSPRLTGTALWVSLPELLRGTVSSFIVLVPGYVLACAAGIVTGILAGTTRAFGRNMNRIARVAAPVPPTVFVPYAIALLPGFRSAAMFVVFVGAFWPVFVNAAAGAAGVPRWVSDNARVLGLGRRDYLVRIVFPASLPQIFSGMAVGLALSFIMLTVAELFGANAGLGRFVQFYADYADYPRMVAGILYTGAVTFACMRLLEAAKHRALFWRR